MAGMRAPAWRAQAVARAVAFRPVVRALMREAVPDELEGFGQAAGREAEPAGTAR
jgi:hypothetical protein